jgi:CO dehydrogenase/acetyl-CoA synthase gamma subunit (corrinoid Fe-S protein)
MPDADLYLERIDFSRYLSTDECKRCGAHSCKELVERLKRTLPTVPSLEIPRPAAAGLFELNNPGPGDPVLVTGNSAFTQEVLLAVLSTTASPFFVLFTDTRGDTLDMAVILGSFTPERIRRALYSDRVEERAGPAPIILPGLAGHLKEDIASVTSSAVEVGPVCAAELPLYFGRRWLPQNR